MLGFRKINKQNNQLNYLDLEMKNIEIGFNSLTNKIFIELWHQLPIAGSCSNRSHKVLKMRIGGDLANILKYFRRKGQKCN